MEKLDKWWIMMTEKRFTLETFTVDCYVENLYVVVDNEKEMTEYQRHQRLTENEVVELLNAQHEEKEYWKKRALLLENKYNEGDSIKWLRNNTVWEKMPTNMRTYTETSYKR